MDTMLAPFIRISHNIKGKGKIGGPSLTDDELALIRKYTIVLSEPDLYPRIEANGSSLEDFLEALFLMVFSSSSHSHPPPPPLCVSYPPSSRASREALGCTNQQRSNQDSPRSLRSSLHRCSCSI
eukprot:764898-Hanusia_phi.AAC.18